MKPWVWVVWCALGCVLACEGEVADGGGGEDSPTPTASGAGSGAAAEMGGGRDAAREGPAVATTEGDAGENTRPSSGEQPDDAGATAVDATTTQPDAAEGPEALADAGTDPTPVAPQGLVPMFVAQGHVGRTIVSCDDGLHWVGNRSLETEADPYVCDSNAAVTCFQDGLSCDYWRDGQCQSSGASCDCDHHPGSATGIAYGDGWFVATWGWGPPGSVRRSHNGIDWEVVLMDTSFGGIAHGQDTFLLGDRQPRLSTDHGESFRQGGAADLRAVGVADETIYNVRALGFVDVMGGRFVLAGESGEKRDVLISSNAGASWWRPSTLPGECAAGTRAVVGGAGVIAIVHRSGDVCYSNDGGDTFALANTGGSVDSRAVWTGERFMAWGRGQAYHSPDGATWTASATTPSDFLPGPVAANPISGRLVAIRGGWQTWYNDQRFYRSDDGIQWTTLDPADIDASSAQNHPMGHMVFGYGTPSSLCPAP